MFIIDNINRIDLGTQPHPKPLTVRDFIHVDPDDYMKTLRRYTSEQASDFNRAGVIIASYQQTKIYESKKEGSTYNFIYYGTGKNDRSYTTQIRKAKSNGYRTILIYVQVDLETSLLRSAHRAEREEHGRVIDEEIIKKINEVLTTNFNIILSNTTAGNKE